MNLSLSSTGVRLHRILDHVRCSAALQCRSFFSDQKTVDVFGAKMSYYDSGSSSNKVVVFLHGNPTSSFLWRNVIPHVKSVARCLAPDLIGMGKSSKLAGSQYTFQDHYKYLEKWMDSVNLPDKVNLVLHDWGSGLGFHWANLNRNKVESITFMEALVCSIKTWDDFPESGREIFKAMRSPAGEGMVIENNFFVERILPASIIRKLDPNEMEVYLEPFKEQGEARRPTLTFPRQIPIASDGPEDVVKLTDDYSAWLSQSAELPKLYVHAKPGFFSDYIKKKIADWPNVTTVEAAGIHFLQEDSPDVIGQAVKKFLTDKVFV